MSNLSYWQTSPMTFRLMDENSYCLAMISRWESQPYMFTLYYPSVHTTMPKVCDFKALDLEAAKDYIMAIFQED